MEEATSFHLAASTGSAKLSMPLKPMNTKSGEKDEGLCCVCVYPCVYRGVVWFLFMFARCRFLICFVCVVCLFVEQCLFYVLLRFRTQVEVSGDEMKSPPPSSDRARPSQSRFEQTDTVRYTNRELTKQPRNTHNTTRDNNNNTKNTMNTTIQTKINTNPDLTNTHTHSGETSSPHNHTYEVYAHSLTQPCPIRFNIASFTIQLEIVRCVVIVCQRFSHTCANACTHGATMSVLEFTRTHTLCYSGAHLKR